MFNFTLMLGSACFTGTTISLVNACINHRIVQKRSSSNSIIFAGFQLHLISQSNLHTCFHTQRSGPFQKHRHGLLVFQQYSPNCFSIDRYCSKVFSFAGCWVLKVIQCSKALLIVCRTACLMMMMMMSYHHPLADSDKEKKKKRLWLLSWILILQTAHDPR